MLVNWVMDGRTDIMDFCAALAQMKGHTCLYVELRGLNNRVMTRFGSQFRGLRNV